MTHSSKIIRKYTIINGRMNIQGEANNEYIAMVQKA